MKVAIVAPNPTFQTDELENAAQSRGIELKRVKLNEINITDPKNDQTVLDLANYDVVYFRNGADQVTKLILGRTLSDMGVKFINSGYYLNPLLAIKIYQNYMAVMNEIKTPTTYTLKEADYNSFKTLAGKIGVPFIIKSSSGAMGKSVYIVKNEEEFNKIINENGAYKMLFQKYILNDGDYRVFIIGHKVAGIFKRIPKEGDFKANISQGGHGELVDDEDLRQKLGHIGLTMAKSLNLEIAGIDVIKSKDNGELYLIESNSIPQWEGLKDTTGIDIANMILDYFEEIIK